MKNRDAINTFSIVGFDPETKEWGVAVASKFLSVGSIVPWAKAGAGAVATQSWANTDYGTKGLELLAQGKSAQEVLDQLVAEDDGRSVRQVGIVDARGGSATYTGEECHAWAGGIAGPNFAAQGNILVDENTVKAMAETFQSTKGSLAERLLQALLAGEEAGGDSRGKQSAALLIVREGGGYGGKIDKSIDLRVDDHREPVRELFRLFGLHQLYFQKPKAEDILEVDAALRAKLASNLIALGYLAKENLADDAVFYEKLKEFQLVENFDERIQETGKVDKQVVAFMDQLAAKRV
ncbi:DUF1028 domain-containing protein [Brevibacillus agri]|uniref:DUF1028 domain-containing protein n=1 Tax=Brevibacillus agri TaxID=51101 RepID=UPI003D22FF40